MANKVSFIIALQDKFSVAAGKINRSIKKIGTNAKKTSRILKSKLEPGLTKAGKKLGTLAKAGFIAVGIAAVAATKKSIFAFDNMEFALANLSAITGTSGKAIESLKQQAIDLSKAAIFSSVDVVNAFTAIASAKSELLEDPKALRLISLEVLKLSTAAQVTAQTAARATVGSLNQFKSAADQAERFVNVLAAGAKVGASLVGETADALKNVGGVAASFGLTFEELNSAIQVLAKSELKGPEAGTGLKTMLSKLEKIADTRFAPSKIGFIKSLEEIEKLGLSNVKIINLFGLDALNTVQILTRNVPLIKKWTEALTATNVAQEQADIINNTAKRRTQALGFAIERLNEEIGEKLAPTIRRLKVGFTEWIDSFSEEDIEDIVLVFKTMLLTMEAIARVLVFIIKLFKTLGTFITDSIGKLIFLFNEDIAAVKIKNFERNFEPLNFNIPIDFDTPDLDDIKKRLNFNIPINFDIPRNFDISNLDDVQKRLDVTHEISSTATLQGEIVVSANNGTKIVSSKLKTESANMNIGINMVPA